MFNLTKVMGNARNRSRVKKRKAPLHQQTENICHTPKRRCLYVVSNSQNGTADTAPNSTQTATSLSGKKLSCDMQQNNGEDNDDYNIIMNFSLLRCLVSTIGKCPNCVDSRLTIQNEWQKRMGFNCNLTVTCEKCDFQFCTSTSKDCTENGRGKSGRQISENNLRSTIAFREIGCGHQAMANFSRLMNMPCLSASSSSKLNDSLYNAYEHAASESMNEAAREIHVASEKLANVPSIALTKCSLDGSWQKRGHSSLNGVVTAIVDGKCIDHMVMSKHCKGYQKWEARKGSAEYQNWLIEHHCQANHGKSSGAMESVGAMDIFLRSIERHALIYKDYIGDGDSSSFKEVSVSDPYNNFGIKPNKLECVGHVQKRLGTRLRNLCNKYKSKKPSLSGRGKLTDKVINSMQNYFGMAIQQNKGQLYPMKKAVGAVLWHCTAFEDETYRHRFCPVGKDSWCKWQRCNGNNLTNKKQESNKNTINLPKWIHDELKPIFEELSKDQLLSKCLHGQTQNANESLNNVIWMRCPKRVFVKRSILEMGVNSAVLEFNNGAIGIEKVLQQYNVSPGMFTSTGSTRKDRQRIKSMEVKMSERGKTRRRKLRSVEKGFLDTEKENEGADAYKSGAY